jgi:methionine-rich copper-binding protein CopC
VHARRRLSLFIVLALLGAAAALAEAHAKLSRSDPPAGSLLRASPPEVRLWFSESLEPAFSSAQLLDGDRRRVGDAVGRVDPANAALLRVPLPPLAPGRYTVAYRVVSIDSHVTAGELTFRIVR